MRMLADMANRFRQDEDGAAMIEYTVLIGLITVFVVAIIALVATQINNDWVALCTTLNGGTPCA